MMEPLGIRNNNPLNIRFNAYNHWQGMEPVPEKGFCKFTTRIWGYVAAIRLMWTYGKRYNIRTVNGIISRWAPASENNTRGYVQRVCHETGLGGNETLLFGVREYKDKAIRFILAMARVECANHRSLNKEEIEEAWDYVFGH